MQQDGLNHCVGPAFLLSHLSKTFLSSSASTDKKEAMCNRGNQLRERPVVVVPKCSSWLSDIFTCARSKQSEREREKRNSNHQQPKRPILIFTWKNCVSHNYWLETPGLSTNHSLTLLLSGRSTLLRTSQHTFMTK